MKLWIVSVNENDLVLTLFQRQEYNGLKKKYYLRLVEKRIKTGIKLKKLSKTFKYETGELSYGKTDNKTIYKIFPLTEAVERIVREHCKNADQFDIDNLNKIISRELL